MDKTEKKKTLERSGVKLPKPVIGREIIKQIMPWMDRDEIIIVTGPRQVGKSVLLYQLILDYLLPKTNEIHYFNLDVPGHRRLLNNPDYLIDLTTKTAKKSYVFIDEIQRLKEPGLFLKGLQDLHLPLKLIVSGSSSLEMQSTVHEALTGRKQVFHLTPFTPKEISRAMFPEKNFTDVIGNDADFQRMLSDYLLFGGYPAVVMAGNPEIKTRILAEIYQSYIEKDIKAFLHVENENAFRNLMKILSSQIGGLVNKEELSGSLGIHKNTLDNYLFYLEQTYMLDFVRPFFRNARKELLKTPKVYFHDTGIRNFVINAFERFSFRPDRGGLFENFCYLCLRNKYPDYTPIYFWRTKAGAEVDFVVAEKKPIPFEVKAVPLKNMKIGKSLYGFLHAYRPDEGFIVNLSLRGHTVISGTTVSFITAADLSIERQDR